MSWKVSTSTQAIILEHGDTCGVTFDVEGFGACVWMLEAFPEGIDMSLRLPGGMVYGIKKYAGLDVRDAMIMTFPEIGEWLHDTMTSLFRVEPV